MKYCKKCGSKSEKYSLLCKKCGLDINDNITNTNNYDDHMKNYSTPMNDYYTLISELKVDKLEHNSIQDVKISEKRPLFFLSMDLVKYTGTLVICLVIAFFVTIIVKAFM